MRRKRKHRRRPKNGIVPIQLDTSVWNKVISVTQFVLCALLMASWLLKIREIPEEEGVLVLKKSNFDEALQTHPNLLVAFYAPSCVPCKELAPEYAKAAGMLKAEGSDIRLGKVDVTAETELRNVSMIPTILFFEGGDKESYSEYHYGGSQAYDIVKWLKKRTSPAVNHLANVAQAESMVANEMAVIGFFKDAESEDAKVFVRAAEVIYQGIDEVIPFGLTSDDEVYSKLGVSKDGVVLFRKFDERCIFDGDLEELTAVDLMEFIEANNQLPLVTEFSKQTAHRIFNADVKSHAFMLMSKAATDFVDKMDQFKKAAEGFKGKILFVFIDTDVNECETVDLKKEQYPTILHWALEDGTMASMMPENEAITTENIIKFCTLFTEDYLRSEYLPKDWDKNPVKVLVGKNFKEVAFDPTKNVFVAFVSPWCGLCRQLEPVWDKLGEQYKDREDIIVAKIDMTANELLSIEVHSYPKFKFFPAGDVQKVMDYCGERTLEGFTRFLESGGNEGGVLAEENQHDDL